MNLELISLSSEERHLHSEHFFGPAMKLLQGLARLSTGPAGPTECEWPEKLADKAMQRQSNKWGWSQVLVNANEKH